MENLLIELSSYKACACFINCITSQYYYPINQILVFEFYQTEPQVTVPITMTRCSRYCILASRYQAYCGGTFQEKANFQDNSHDQQQIRVFTKLRSTSTRKGKGCKLQSFIHIDIEDQFYSQHLMNTSMCNTGFNSNASEHYTQNADIS